VDDDTAAARDLVLEVRQRGNAAILTPKGELDATTAPDLVDLCRSIHARGARDIVIDLTDTSFLDSSGLRALISAQQLFAAPSAAMRLSHPSPPVMRLLDITGLTDYFPIDNRPDA
jgi:anti-anti-sigma factor